MERMTKWPSRPTLPFTAVWNTPKRDGINLTLDLYVPERAGPQRAPLHLGLRRRVAQPPDVLLRCTRYGILQHGFAVAKIDYRMSGEAKFPAQIIDVKTAIRFLRSHAEKFGGLTRSGLSSAGSRAAGTFPRWQR